MLFRNLSTRASMLMAGPQPAEAAMQTPGRRPAGTQLPAGAGPPATPALLSPFASPLQRTGVRGAPQRVATPAAERCFD